MEELEYIKRGVSPFHVVEQSKEWLLQETFTELFMQDDWELEPGRGYYVSPYPSVLFAFRPGDEQVRIVTGHTDQPMLKVKPNPTIKREGGLVVNVESYGGMILHTWFDRPLGLAGKLVCRSEDVFHPHVLLYDSRRPVAVIPSLAIHMDREVNKKNELNCQVHLLPLCGLKEENATDEEALLAFVAEQMDINVEDILDYDLYFYNPADPERVGVREELVVSPRLDNLTSCYSALAGMVSAGSEHTCIAALFDNEEIGSRSKQGADSNLFSMVLGKILFSMNQSMGTAVMSGEKLIQNGFVVSLDVAHACHPNYGEKSDPTTKTLLGGGVVLKTSGSQKYHSDSASAGVILQLCREHGISCQRQINRSDIPGGSTLGPIVSSYIPIPGVDAGVGILAMHSAVETAAAVDLQMLNRFVSAFFAQD